MASLLDLPKEIILLIAEYLGPIATKNLKQTCSRFYYLFQDKFYWEHFSKKYIQECFPPIIRKPPDAYFNWENSLCQFINERTTWSKVQNINSVDLINMHCASIDAVLLIKNSEICLSGSRDRTLALWDVPQCLRGIKTAKTFKLSAHNGWIWDLCENPRTRYVYSASWDKTVKVWDIGQSIENLNILLCSKTALSVEITSCNLIAVGLYNGTMQLYDATTCDLVGAHSFHKKPIFQIVTYGNYIFTASQDRRIGIFDLRSWQADTHKVMSQSLPLSLSVCANLLYVGDSWGNLHLFDSQTFQKITSYNIVPNGRRRQITGIKHNSGSIITSSSDGHIRVFTLTDPPKLIQEYPTIGEAIALDYKNQIMAVGNANNALNLLAHDLHPFFN